MPQGLYVLLFFGSFLMYVMYGFGRMSERDVVISCCLFAICVNHFRIACSVPAGDITKGGSMAHSDGHVGVKSGADARLSCLPWWCLQRR